MEVLEDLSSEEHSDSEMNSEGRMGESINLVGLLEEVILLSLIILEILLFSSCLRVFVVIKTFIPSARNYTAHQRSCGLRTA